jgi:hypothetical protein
VKFLEELLKYLVAGAFLGFVVGAIMHASKVHAAEPETFITTMVRSYHFKRPTLYNEENYGLGIERTINENWRFSAGFYRNSQRNDSVYIGTIYTPLNYRGFHAGVTLGVISGYNDSVVPAVFPTLIYEYKKVGMNLTIVPGSVVGLHLKYKFE